MASLPFQQIVAALRLRDYRIYLCGNVVSMVGLWTQRIAVGWLAWELTHSGAWLGIVAFADLCPSLVVGPFAGVLADRLDRLKIMRVSQMLSMAQAVVLAVLAMSGAITIWMLFTLVLVNGIISSVNQPSRLAVISSLVPRAHLSSAIALNSISFNLARFIGPAVAGALILSIGVGAAFAVNAISFLAFLIALSLIKVADTRVTGARAKQGGVFGMFMSISGIAIQTTVQMAADTYVRGRTLSVYGLIMRAAPATGALILGVASEIAGLRLPLVLAVIACLFVWLNVWRRRDSIDPAVG